MLPRHWVLIALCFIVGYFAGLYFPAPGRKVLGKIAGQ